MAGHPLIDFHQNSGWTRSSPWSASDGVGSSMGDAPGGRPGQTGATRASTRNKPWEASITTGIPSAELVRRNPPNYCFP